MVRGWSTPPDTTGIRLLSARQPSSTLHILKRELTAHNLSANRLALALRLPSVRITEILGGKRAISPDTALRLGRYFGISPRFWANLQTAFDLAEETRLKGECITTEVIPAEAA